MENEPKKVSVLLVTILTILLSAIVTGGVVYAVQNRQNSKTRDDLQAQVDALKAKVAALPTATPTITSSTTATPTPAVTSTPATVAALTNTQLLNFTYKDSNDKDVKLTNGSGTFESSGIAQGTVTLDQDSIASGDINADGVADSAVILWMSTGGTGSFPYVATVINNGGTPVLADQATVMGDRGVIDSVKISGGLITVTGKVHGANQASSEVANVAQTDVFKLVSGKLVKQ